MMEGSPPSRRMQFNRVVFGGFHLTAAPVSVPARRACAAVNCKVRIPAAAHRGISLSGPAETHNRYRLVRMLNGSPSMVAGSGETSN